MSASTAIGMVGESLKDLLEEEMQISTDFRVTLLGPDENGPARRINLFLYRVEENTFLKNQDWSLADGGSGRIQPPPLSLNLFYLMTAYAQNDSELGNVNAHEVLGEAMRVLHENPAVPRDYLAEGLLDAREQLKVIMHRIDLDELSKVWGTFGEPYRPSVAYEISVVQLDQTDERQREMAPRVRRIGKPGVEAPFHPPQLLASSPAQGVPGAEVYFEGRNLVGWRAYVSLDGRRLGDGIELEGDSFSVTLPSDIQLGFHVLKVDVSRLHRSSFVFEVI